MHMRPTYLVSSLTFAFGDGSFFLRKDILQSLSPLIPLPTAKLNMQQHAKTYRLRNMAALCVNRWNAECSEWRSLLNSSLKS